MQACALNGVVELVALGVESACGKIGRNQSPRRPADGDAREWPGNEEMVPGTHLPGAFGLEMKGANSRAG